MENKEEINAKKKKNAFTLIELLAIIVILAIIAVITVPIILNIIDNSRKGAATDSAYGYKDAVNKAYIQELVKPDNGNLKLNGNYTVQSNALVPSTDNTFGFGVTNYNSLPVDVSGDKPSSGTLTYSNNVLTSGCLVIGDYAVTFNGNETSAVKGTCSASEQGNGGSTQNTVSPVVYRNNEGTVSSTPADDITSATDLNVGDYVKLGDDDGFYVIKKPTSTDTTVLLLAEYKLSNTAASAQTGYNAPSNNGITFMSNKTYVAEGEEESPATYRQTSGNDYYKPAFATEYYWENCITTTSEDPVGCSTIYRPKKSGEEYTFVYPGSQDTNKEKNNLYAPMENYKDYLETATGLTLTVRPMSYYEADSIIGNSWAYNQSYWLGSENFSLVWCVDSGGDLDSIHYDYNLGVRPVIEISTSAF